MSDDLEICTPYEAQEVVWTYAELVRRAIRLTGNAPYWGFVTEEEWARLVIDGQTATLYWPYLTTDWDSPVIETKNITFPTNLLFMSDTKCAAWKKEQRALYDAKEKRRIEDARTADRLAAEARDKTEYERLKMKFGNGQQTG